MTTEDKALVDQLIDIGRRMSDSKDVRVIMAGASALSLAGAVLSGGLAGNGLAEIAATCINVAKREHQTFAAMAVLGLQ